MRATDQPTQRRCNGWRVWCFAAALVASALNASAGVAQPAVAPAACQMADDATVASLTEQWLAAIQSQHPDHIARLFEPDATLRGFASEAARTDYAAIRAYYLYYFQFDPKVRLEEHQVRFGCNFVIDEGNYTWLLKHKDADAVVSLPARYRFVYEFSAGRWLIGEHIEELTLENADDVAFSVPDPASQHAPIIIAPDGAAVAGFLQRPAPEATAPGLLDHRAQSTDVPNHNDGPRLIAAHRSPAGPKPQEPSQAGPVEPQDWKSDIFQSPR